MKRVIGLLLALTVALSLAACGSTASSAASSEAASPEAASSDAASSEAASSEAASETETAELSTVEPGKLIMSTNAAFPPLHCWLYSRASPIWLWLALPLPTSART